MSTHISVPPQLLLERILTLELVRVTERAAVSAARLRGHGNEKAADQAAVDAMRRELNKLPIEGTVVIGEGERDEAPMLFIGEAVGLKAGPKVDIAVDPLEGTTLCAKNMPGAIATMAMADGGTLLHAPDVYMQKLAIGPGYAKGVVELDAPPADMVMLDLADSGNYFAVRPSGTEPKVKFYTFAAAPPCTLDEVPAIRQQLRDRLAALEKDIRQFAASAK